MKTINGFAVGDVARRSAIEEGDRLLGPRETATRLAALAAKRTYEDLKARNPLAASAFRDRHGLALMIASVDVLKAEERAASGEKVTIDQVVAAVEQGAW